MKGYLPFTEFLFLFILCGAHALATPGDLDLSFSGDGKATFSVAGMQGCVARGVVVQPDGKILVAGYCSDGSSRRYFGLMRINLDGSLDSTFNVVGTVAAGFPNNASASCQGILLQDDGRIILSGDAGGKFALARFLSNGGLDTSFNGTGLVESAQDGTGWRAALQADGKIVMVGDTDVGEVAHLMVIRLNADGTPDSSFGTNGSFVSSEFMDRGIPRVIAVQGDGKIVLAADNAFNLLVFRLTSQGILDGAFGTGGLSTIPALGYTVSPTGVCVTQDGRILFSVVWFSKNPSRWYAGLASLDSNGSAIQNFGDSGRVATSVFGHDDRGNCIALQRDGKIVTAGFGDLSGNGSQYDFLVLRYSPNGVLDPTFGSGGVVSTPFQTSLDYAWSLAITPDGKIVAAGVANSGSVAAVFAVTRYISGVSQNVPATPMWALTVLALLLLVVASRYLSRGGSV